MGTDRRRDNKNFKPRDGKQGNGGKKIDLKSLRKEGGNKHPQGNKQKQHGGHKKPFKKHGDKKRHGQKKPEQSKEALDREMENYWLKAGQKDIGKISPPANFVQ